MLGCFGVQRFWASLQHSSKPSESTRPKPLVGSAAATTTMAHAQAAGAKNIDPAFRHHRQRESGKARQTSTLCRPRCAALWPGSATSRGRGAAPRTQRPPSCSRYCSWAGAHSPQGISPHTTARRSTSWQWRQDGGFLGGSGFPDVVRQLCTLEQFQRVHFSGEPSGRSWFLASWRGGHSGSASCWSSWCRVAFGRRSGLRGSGERKKTVDAATSARPCRQRDMQRLHVLWAHNTGNLKAAAPGAVPSDVLPGQILRDGEDITMDPLTLHIDCEGTIATVNGPKCKALGAGDPRARVWSRLLVSFDEVTAVKVKCHATQRDVEAGCTSHLFKRGKRLCRHLCQERDRHTQACFSSRQDSRCLCLLGQASGAMGGRARGQACERVGLQWLPRGACYDQERGQNKVEKDTVTLNEEKGEVHPRSKDKTPNDTWVVFGVRSVAAWRHLKTSSHDKCGEQCSSFLPRPADRGGLATW